MNRQYAFEPSKLKDGSNELRFKIDRSFFAEFEHSLIEEGDILIQVEIVKCKTHLDVSLQIEGVLQLPCDRCLEWYPHEVKTTKRIILTYETRADFKNEEVIIIQEDQPWVDLSKEFYDFIHLEIPLRKVPETETHLCDEETLRVLGLIEDDEIKPLESSEEIIDPRWEELKKLRFDQNK